MESKSLRDDAIAVLCNANSCKQHRADFDRLLVWFDTNAERIAWDHDSAEDLQAMVAVLRG